MRKTPLFVLIACFAVLLAVPVGKSGLPGYDDALYAHIAKEVYLSGDWLNLKSNGYPALEHPPLLPWMEALVFEILGPEDYAARIPAAACGFGTILLVWWLARRLFPNEEMPNRDSSGEDSALLAMFVMGTSLYFLKYAARAMTDVPFAFFFLAAVCCWKQAELRPRWLLLAGVFTAAAQMTRGMMGFALVLLFALDLMIARRRPHWAYTLGALFIAFLPPVLWSWYLAHTYGDFYFAVHKHFLSLEIVFPNPVTSLRFVWMLAKSYWPWFPAMLAGLWFTRNRLLLVWIGSVLAACAAVKNPVLRYLLPAYPAFALASGNALARWTPAWAIRYAAPAIAAGVALTAVFLPVTPQGTETRPMALAATKATKEGERIGFYDAGQPRFDETNQIQWYGDRSLYILETPGALNQALEARKAAVFIVDRTTQQSLFPNARVIATAGHLICVRLS